MAGVHLPTLNAGLNLLSACFLTGGFAFIRRKNIPAHRACMIGALTTSTLFLASYLYYHASAGVTRFAGTGALRTAYLWILGTHTVLAAVVLPLVLVTTFYALRGRFENHARVARWTWPVWMYVSVTGVVVYWMLYHL